MANVELINKNGRAVMYIDGSPVSPVLYALSDIPGSRSNTFQAHKNISAFAEHGIKLICVDTAIMLGWHKYDPLETEPVLAEIAGALSACPDAYIFIRLHMNAPYWWIRDCMESCPEELVEYNGKPGVDNGECIRFIGDDGKQRCRPSLSSEKWKREAGEVLARICRDISATDEGKRVVAIQPACGIYGEWHQWGLDTSVSMQRRFTKYLSDTYGTDEELQKAWHDSNVTIDTAVYDPVVHEEQKNNFFLSPEKDMRTVDSQKCLQTVPPETIVHFCKIIKNNWQGSILTGAFYSYYIGSWDAYAPIKGHLFPEIIFNSRKYVDFVCGPQPYLDNRLPECTPLSRTLLESVRLAGMLWLSEMDESPLGAYKYPGGSPEKRGLSISHMRRNSFLTFVSGHGLWFYDHRIAPICVKYEPESKPGSIYFKHGWWDNEILMNEIEKIKKCADKYAIGDFKAASDVLIVSDTKSQFWQTGVVGNEYTIYDIIGHSGAAYDMIYLNDFDKAELERYKVIIFLNAWKLTDAGINSIKEKCKNKKLIWFYAAGICSDKSLAFENISRISGMKISKFEAPMNPAYTDFCSDSVEYALLGNAPYLKIDGGYDEQIGVYENTDICAAARTGNSYHFALPCIGQKTLQKIYADAGVHVYTPDRRVIILAGSGVVLANTARPVEFELSFADGCKKTVLLPEMTTAVFDSDTHERVL